MKSIIVLFSVLNFIYLRAQINLDSNLTACYALNGNAFDPINSLNGIMYNTTPTSNRFNNQNSALSFNGSANSFIELPNDPLLKPNKLSFSAWVKPESGATFGGYIVLAPANPPSIDFGAYSLVLNSNSVGGPRFEVVKCGGLSMDFVTSSTISAGAWYHVVFTTDSNSLKIYVNGILENSVSTSTQFIYHPTEKVVLGGIGNYSFHYNFLGLIDNVRFYNRVISSAEVTQLFQNDPSCQLATTAPQASFAISSAKCVGQAIQFNDLSFNNPDYWIWQFPGGVCSNSLDPNPIVTYTSSGSYLAVLNCSNAAGSSSTSLNILVNPLPTITIVPSSTLLCRYMTYTLNAFGAQNYSWTSQNSGSTLLNTGSSYVFTALNTNTYTVIGSDSMGCESSASRKLNTVICEMWGINEDKKDNLKYDLFPNPVESFVSIKLAEGKIEEFVLRDLFGKTILQEKGLKEMELTINLEGLNKGMYFLQVNCQNRSGIIKLVKE